MPTYEYKCKACEHVFEKFQSFSDEPLKECSKCKGELFKLIGKNIGVTFSGPGFYVTDTKEAKVRALEKNEKANKKKKS